METSSSSGTRPVRCVNTKALTEAAQSRRGPFGCHRHPLLPQRNFLSGCCPKQDIICCYYSLQRQAHISVWPHITTGLFDVTLGGGKKSGGGEGGHPNIFLLCLPSFQGKLQGNPEQQQYTADKSYICRHTSHLFGLSRFVRNTVAGRSYRCSLHHIIFIYNRQLSVIITGKLISVLSHIEIMAQM